MSNQAKILCSGEALIDMIPVESQTGSLAYQPCSGGAVFNTAIALGRLGVATEFLTGLSSDLFGEQIKASLAESGVATSLCKQSQLPTTLAFVKLDNGHATYHFYDENSAGRMLSIDDVGPVPASIDALFFGGISLAVEPCARTYEAIAVRESNNHVIMMDPNVRPGFIQDASVYRARIMNMLSHCDIVKVSDEDLAWLMPSIEGLGAQVDELRKAGPSIILVTKGADGATAYLMDNREVSVASEKVEVADTVGAGDTFNAGILTKLAELDMLDKTALKTISEEHIAAAMAFAAKVAAVTVSRKGANPPWRKEL
ncbi:carbohydrate kinase family protein [Cohaesibacter celericrescens]|uniref:Carbohydrate kinase n=1 Tax=Cohaesibacter celericrescens TaxID=2067669 RepID=A0A2N5XW00_9HYPH|nr:carbohydrate kinase [Cohaesibacter celericrescens]PLW78681.1 carbohydrate kinase [Cohaesibacter celericrescens]